MGQPSLEAGHPDGRQRALHPLVDLDLGNPHVERSEGHVLEDGRAEQLVVGILEDETDLGADPSHALPVDERPADPDGAVRRGS